MLCNIQSQHLPTPCTRKSSNILCSYVLSFLLLRYIERANLEELFFIMQTKSNAYRLKPYLPPEGVALSDINVAWQELEKGEHQREIRLRKELARFAKGCFAMKLFFSSKSLTQAYVLSFLAKASVGTRS